MIGGGRLFSNMEVIQECTNLGRELGGDNQMNVQEEEEEEANDMEIEREQDPASAENESRDQKFKRLEKEWQKNYRSIWDHGSLKHLGTLSIMIFSTFVMFEVHYLNKRNICRYRLEFFSYL